MKIKTSELIDRALDWAVTECEQFVEDVFEPSENWADGGPIIERERISIEYMAGAGDAGLDVWVATRIEGTAVSEEQGPTPLIAAMRCYVVSHLGEEVDVPEELG